MLAKMKDYRILVLAVGVTLFHMRSSCGGLWKHGAERHSDASSLLDSFEQAMNVHRAEYPALAAGEWVHRPDQPGASLSPQYMKCLEKEYVGNCHDPNHRLATSMSAKKKAVVHNSQGILEGRDEWMWQSNHPLYQVLPQDANYTSTLYRLLGTVQNNNETTAVGSSRGVVDRIFLMGDSVTRQWSQMMRCELIHVLNRTEEQARDQVQYIPVSDLRSKYQDPVVQERLKLLTKRDIVVWNIGHQVDQGKLRGDKGREWKQAYSDNFEKRGNRSSLSLLGSMPDDRIWFRTTTVRHFLRGLGDVDTNTSKAGGQFPYPRAHWSQYGGLYPSQPAQNLMALKHLHEKSKTSEQGNVDGNDGMSRSNRRSFRLLDIAPMMLARADATFDGTNFCLPGPMLYWSRMLYFQLQDLPMLSADR